MSELLPAWDNTVKKNEREHLADLHRLLLKAEERAAGCGCPSCKKALIGAHYAYWSEVDRLVDGVDHEDPAVMFALATLHDEEFINPMHRFWDDEDPSPFGE